MRFKFAPIALLLLTAVGTAAADRKGEIGAFAGFHIFNDNNELGIPDDGAFAAVDHGVAFGLRAAIRIASSLDLEGEALLIPTGAREGDASVTATGLRLHALFHLGEGRLRPFVVVGAGTSSSFSDDETLIGNDTDFVVHAGAGLKYGLRSGWGLRFDARALAPPSTDGDGPTLDGEFLIGFYKEFGSVEEAVALDDDGDGIANQDDQCPGEPEDVDGVDDQDGCPDAEVAIDTDGDGVTDSADKCPNEKEDMDDFEDGDGCPEADNDGDDIDDQDDQCPLKAEDKDGFEDEDGCPDDDNDGDGVPDAEDQCGNEAETKNGFEDDDGCPDEVPKEVQRFSGRIQGIQFKTGEATIRVRSTKILDKAVKVFSDFPDLRFEVQGHTDSVGGADRNLQLSQERANAVRDYFISKGIDASRIEAKGYGQDVPISDNRTARGRESNRRVEFKLLSN